MSQVIDHACSSPTRFTWRERDDLVILGDVHGLAVGIIDDVVYVGFNPTIASWTVERSSGKVWAARIADGMGRPCNGWLVPVGSIEEAMTRIVADSETEGWDR